ncbi:MAG TPA: NAD(P)H-binding protein [Paraburkholderia sp.]|jgi:uncharacterized protein YbjT (DUF2867 family)|uniref:NAD(P)H-binding protein n=1 Tax=Paraburkholderia sp. TaxID=1926495 RepID=UPI002B485590|nr:NAD(P)H-binding protein [Paraburkholderia sp.]HKR43582.1 NAD(P)H-binding protein [Paraburkholderia sp.]
MTNVLILGANGHLARNTIPVFLRTDVRLRLFLRKPARLKNPDPARAEVMEGDVLDDEALTSAMQGQDVVYANLAGPMAQQAKNIITAMHATGLKRLIFISSMGIYDEVPGERYRSILDPYRDSAALIEASDLEYTILRPGWFKHDPGVNYKITRKGEPFSGHNISLDSLSHLIVELALTPGLYARESIGVSDR